MWLLLQLGHANSYTTLDLFCLGTLSFAFVNKFMFSLVVVTLVLIGTFVMLPQRNSFPLTFTCTKETMTLSQHYERAD